MRRAGFRVLGFGIESFSPRVLAEFNKAQIHRHIEPMLAAALDEGITPFLDLILSSPRADARRCRGDVARGAIAGCGGAARSACIPTSIPFSGARFARDPTLVPHTVMADRRVAGTNIEWQQAAKILPMDPTVRDAILRIENAFEDLLYSLQSEVAHLPSRVRSLLWILCSIPVMAEHGIQIADEAEVRAELLRASP